MKELVCNSQSKLQSTSHRHHLCSVMSEVRDETSSDQYFFVTSFPSLLHSSLNCMKLIVSEEERNKHKTLLVSKTRRGQQAKKKTDDNRGPEGDTKH